MSAIESPQRAGAVLRTHALEKHYGEGEGLVRALDAVELEVIGGETVGGDGTERMREVDAAAPARRSGTPVGR